MEKAFPPRKAVKQQKNNFFGKGDFIASVYHKQESQSAQGKFFAPAPLTRSPQSDIVQQKEEAPDKAETQETHQTTHSRSAIQRQVAPTAGAPTGNDYNTYMSQLRIAETAAQGDGYSNSQIIAAIRKLYYNTGTWNVVIAGSASTGFPPSWMSNPTNQAAVEYLRNNQIVVINSRQVDIGHLLTGIDARLNPSGVSLAGGIISMRSNQEVATYVGDIGSAVKHYVDNERRWYQPIGVGRDDAKLRQYYDDYVSAPDMAGNVDSYNVTLDPTKTLSQNLNDYYTNATNGDNKRYTNFCRSIGLGTLSGGAFSGDNAAFREGLKTEIYNFALAYHFAQDGKFVGLFTWEGTVSYNRASEWMTEIFINDMVAKVRGENVSGGAGR